MDSINQYTSLIGQAMSSIGILFLVYNHFRNPDIKAANEINEIKTSYQLKHEKLDYVINQISKNLDAMNQRITLLQENDIKHIELEMRELSTNQTKILTILEYKEGKKI